jgi:HAD superfamily hydrolase (TIGR01549 family)
VLFDLDDTLVPQGSWLAGAWAAVADAGAQLGADRDALYESLVAVASEGTDRGGIIDRSLRRCGASTPVQPLVEAFWAYRPERVACYPGARRSVINLARLVPVGIVTDGHVETQRAKIAAAGLAEVMAVVVFSDEIGGARRKPHPDPFLRALELLGTGPEGTVFVGDRPDKDIAGAQSCGMRALRVRTGEYGSVPDIPRPWRTAADAVVAIAMLEDLLVG